MKKIYFDSSPARIWLDMKHDTDVRYGASNAYEDSGVFPMTAS